VSEQAPHHVDAIHLLKYAYLRLLDTKQFDRLGELLTDDVTSAFDSGALAFRGRDDVVGFLVRALSDDGVLTMHTVHHPEIVLGPDTTTGTDSVSATATATGTWYLEDRVIVPAQDFELHGTALYHDDYRLDDGRWRISHTGYDRIFEERRRRSTGEVLSMRTMFDARTGLGDGTSSGTDTSA
jgi:ketosteroid isomerase-like protein